MTKLVLPKMLEKKRGVIVNLSSSGGTLVPPMLICYGATKVYFTLDLDLVGYILLIARVYNNEGGRVSYSSIVPCTAVVRVRARLMIFTMCGVIYCVIVGSRICVVRQRACHAVGSCVKCESTSRCEYH